MHQILAEAGGNSWPWSPRWPTERPGFHAAWIRPLRVQSRPDSPGAPLRTCRAVARSDRAGRSIHASKDASDRGPRMRRSDCLSLPEIERELRLAATRSAQQRKDPQARLVVLFTRRPRFHVTTLGVAFL